MHLKTQLEINGRNNLIQQKTTAAMLAQQMQFMMPGAQIQPVVSIHVFKATASRIKRMLWGEEPTCGATLIQLPFSPSCLDPSCEYTELVE